MDPIVVAFASGLAKELGSQLVKEIFGTNEAAVVGKIVAGVQDVVNAAFDRFQVQGASVEVGALATRIRQYHTAGASEAQIYTVYDGSALALRASQQTGPYANTGPSKFEGIWGHHLFLTAVNLRVAIVQDLMKKAASREQKGRHASNLLADLTEAIAYATKLEQRWKAWNNSRFGPLRTFGGMPPRYMFTLDGKNTWVPISISPLLPQKAKEYREEMIAREWREIYQRIVQPSEQVRAHWESAKPKKTGFLWAEVKWQFGERRLPVEIPQPA
jgi:hypothetical protein